ncbi:hypothetical protein Pst134EA_019579 [Puccinia striiformis f. sp. tritici]|uniref:hypothetical protein n=1 Tax=Puccinia striiformis f. sp. tritici TaxID=168172 RepID=UPI0020083FE4|nr:hypothetical protein Pst134EA_019579 [Puccinia striiformis f. sp. tritici]KAH9459426.1 hypothetical protein Pst134EA_019579 [Puccinia striiformis f. sp. tritici]
MLMCIATSYLLLQLKVLALPAPGVVDTDVLSSWDQIYEELQQQPIFRSAGFPERSEDVINYKRRFDRSVDCTESAFRENSHSSHDVNESNARFIASEEDRHVPRQVEKRRRVATEVLDDSWAPTVTQPGDSIQFTRNLAVHPEHYPAAGKSDNSGSFHQDHTPHGLLVPGAGLHSEHQHGSFRNGYTNEILPTSKDSNMGSISYYSQDQMLHNYINTEFSNYRKLESVSWPTEESNDAAMMKVYPHMWDEFIPVPFNHQVREWEPIPSDHNPSSLQKLGSIPEDSSYDWKALASGNSVQSDLFEDVELEAILQEQPISSLSTTLKENGPQNPFTYKPLGLKLEMAPVLKELNAGDYHKGSTNEGETQNLGEFHHSCLPPQSDNESLLDYLVNLVNLTPNEVTSTSSFILESPNTNTLIGSTNSHGFNGLDSDLSSIKNLNIDMNEERRSSVITSSPNHDSTMNTREIRDQPVHVKMPDTLSLEDLPGSYDRKIENPLHLQELHENSRFDKIGNIEIPGLATFPDTMKPRRLGQICKPLEGDTIIKALLDYTNESSQSDTITIHTFSVEGLPVKIHKKRFSKSQEIKMYEIRINEKQHLALNKEQLRKKIEFLNFFTKICHQTLIHIQVSLGVGVIDNAKQSFDVWLSKVFFIPEDGSLPVVGEAKKEIKEFLREHFGPIQIYLIENYLSKLDAASRVVQVSLALIGYWYTTFHPTFFFKDHNDYWNIMKKILGLTLSGYRKYSPLDKHSRGGKICDPVFVKNMTTRICFTPEVYKGEKSFDWAKLNSKIHVQGSQINHAVQS